MKNRQRGNVLQHKTPQTVLLILAIGLLFVRHVDMVSGNLAMVFANHVLADDRYTLAISRSYFSFTVQNLSSEQINDSQESIRRITVGNLYWKTGNKELALNYWNKAGIEPEHFISRVNNIEQSSSLDFIDRAIALSPNRSELLYYKGLHFEKNADYVMAEQWYALAEKYDNWINPLTGFNVLYERGQLLYQNQKIIEAEKAFASALQFSDGIDAINNEKVASAHRILGLISQQNGNIATAKSHFLEAVQLNPEDFWNYLSLGLIAEAEKESEEVIFNYFNRAHIVAPRTLLAYVYPASHYFGGNQLDKWRYFCDITPESLHRQQQYKEACQVSN
jgi:tetratricopeptide (TPR) repeat protein